MRWGVCGWVVVLIAGCGRLGYDPLVADDGPRVLGTATCGDGASQIVVDSEVPPGSVVLVQAAVRGDGGDCSVIDSQHNDYNLIAGPGGDQIRISVFVSEIAGGLEPGDAIEVTHPTGTSTSVLAVDLGDVTPRPPAVSAGGASNYDIDLQFSEPSTGLSYCAVAVRNAAFAIDEPWIEADVITSTCGGGVPFTANNAGYWLPAGSGASACTGSITSGANHWSAVVATFPE